MSAPDVGARERVSALLFNALISYDSGGCCGPPTSTQEVEAICDYLADRILAALAETRVTESEVEPVERRCIIPARFDDRRMFNRGRSARRLASAGSNERSYKERRCALVPSSTGAPSDGPR